MASAPARPAQRPAAAAGAGGAAWLQLLRVSALFTVPGDAVAGAAAAGRAPNRGTALAAGASLCLYEAGMALNDWADRDIDAVERPSRPLPSGRIAPGAALGAAAGLTAAGLGLAAAAGRPALATATALAGTVWAYDLRLKQTAAGPAAMAAARALDLLLGATATAGAARGAVRPGGHASTAAVPGAATPRGGTASRARRDTASDVRGGATPRALRGGAVPDRAGRPGTVGAAARQALPAAGLLGAHTYAVTLVSRRETEGGSTLLPLAGLAALGCIARAVSREPEPHGGARSGASSPGETHAPGADRSGPGTRRAAPRRQQQQQQPPSPAPGRLGRVTAGAVLAAGYAVTAGRPFAYAALNPSPHFYQQAVGGGIRAMIPLQAALAARAGRLRTAVPLLALLPVARRLSRKVSPT